MAMVTIIPMIMITIAHQLVTYVYIINVTSALNLDPLCGLTTSQVEENRIYHINRKETENTSKHEQQVVTSQASPQLEEQSSPDSWSHLMTCHISALNTEFQIQNCAIVPPDYTERHTMGYNEHSNAYSYRISQVHYTLSDDSDMDRMSTNSNLMIKCVTEDSGPLLLLLLLRPQVSFGPRDKKIKTNNKTQTL